MIPKDTEAPTAEILFTDLYRTKFHLRHFGIANATGGIKAIGLEGEKLTFYRSKGEITGGIMLRTEMFIGNISTVGSTSRRASAAGRNESMAQLVEKVRLLERKGATSSTRMRSVAEKSRSPGCFSQSTTVNR